MKIEFEVTVEGQVDLSNLGSIQETGLPTGMAFVDQDGANILSSLKGKCTWELRNATDGKFWLIGVIGNTLPEPKVIKRGCIDRVTRI